LSRIRKRVASEPFSFFKKKRRVRGKKRKADFYIDHSEIPEDSLE
jgi:hypothetical protein